MHMLWKLNTYKTPYGRFYQLHYEPIPTPHEDIVALFLETCQGRTTVPITFQAYNDNIDNVISHVYCHGTCCGAKLGEKISTLEFVVPNNRLFLDDKTFYHDITRLEQALQTTPIADNEEEFVINCIECISKVCS